jgi:hypothetical protein
VEFWSLIARSKSKAEDPFEQIDFLTAILSTRSEEDIIAFQKSSKNCMPRLTDQICGQQLISSMGDALMMDMIISAARSSRLIPFALDLDEINRVSTTIDRT